MDIDLRASFGSGFGPGFCGRRVFVGWSARWGALAGSVVRCVACGHGQAPVGGVVIQSFAAANCASRNRRTSPGKNGVNMVTAPPIQR